ncbi:MAG: response regulator [Chloroflexota bacterium]|nr:response regulator [Chloroflexota bacterium]
MSGTLSKALEASGYRVLVASTGAEARAFLHEIQSDLIILDLMLPDIDGLSLTGTFRNLTRAPILICSARQGQLDRVLGLKLGASDFVAKPFELDELEARVEAVLRRSHQADEQARVDDIDQWRHSHRVRLASVEVGGRAVDMMPTQRAALARIEGGTRLGRRT